MLRHDAIVRSLLTWFRRAARDLPWRRTADPYAIWISEVMLQQTQVRTVVPYWQRWMRRLPAIRDLARANPQKILKLWEGLGYYTRARNLQRAARMIVENHGGRFPECFSEVLALPGIGRYTAGAVCSIAFNQPTPAVDGNVVRVLTRVFGISENPRERATNDRLWRLAQTLVTRAAGIQSSHRRNCASFNQSLMELGATVCTPREPDCPACPLRRRCVARREGSVDTLPNLGRRESATARRFVALVVVRDGRFFVRRRPAAGVNAHLWEFPNVEVNHGSCDPGRVGRNLLGVAITSPKAFHRIKHTITRYRITLEVFRAELARPRTRVKGPGRWCSLTDLKRLPFTSAHGKVVRRLGQGRVGGSKTA
ncbi:MAG: A/G-specific adenine glycosylase [Limisphaerales bacterium]